MQPHIVTNLPRQAADAAPSIIPNQQSRWRSVKPASCRRRIGLAAQRESARAGKVREFR